MISKGVDAAWALHICSNGVQLAAVLLSKETKNYSIRAATKKPSRATALLVAIVLGA